MNEILEWKHTLGRWVSNPWDFCVDCIYTKDPVDETNPIKKFPAHFEYLKLFTKIWQMEKRLAVPKSRRMFMSWHCLALVLWDAMFHKGRQIAIVSKKEDDANELIQRIVFMLENIREEDFPQDLRPRYNAKFNRIDFPQMNSWIQGFPQGADQLRQLTLSRILADEMAFWEDAKETYSASLPTLDGGGAITSISSRSPGFFKDLVFDTFDGNQAEPVKHYLPMEGVEVWRNARNRFVVFELHYTADERKRDPAYRERIKSELPYSQYMMEYEKSWETMAGRPVYPDWSRSLHGNTVEEHPELGIPLVLGLDQGLTPAVLVIQPKDDGNVILREYTAENMGAERFKEYVKGKLAIDYPQWHSLENDFIVGIDPTALNRRDTDERTYASIWAKDFTVIPGENSFEKRKQSVEKELTSVRKGRPTFRVNLMNCPVLVRGFEGEYHYPDKMFEVTPAKARPLKNFASNVHDALQYGLTGLLKRRKKHRVNPPVPKYDFSGGLGHGKRLNRNIPGYN